MAYGPEIISNGICTICAARVPLNKHSELRYSERAGFYSGNDSWEAMHARFHNTFIPRAELDEAIKRLTREAQTMGSAAWCDKGNHAFKAGVQGSQSMTMTEQGEEGPRNVIVDLCPEHAFPTAETTQKAVTADATAHEPTYGRPVNDVW
jgi:hypothetical protein